MSSSQISRVLAVGILALSVPVVVIGQTYSPNGEEYRLAGALPGDQIKPSASISALGGYAVWQDNATDGEGWGISARVLDSSLHAALPPFRVNGTGKWDQENPKVVLLNNGGAAFVWQGGRQGFQHIYARFLSSSNTWLGLDQMVNSSTRVYQANPAVTVLSNGNVLVVYSIYNTNTMQDVYGQILSPSGEKIGGEFQLNQYTPFNQRSAVVAALSDGGFVAAWVSEQQRTSANIYPEVVSLTNSDGSLIYTTNWVTTYRPSQFTLPSVDIYARVFDANGAAAGTEFLVNSTTNVCANPAVTAGSGGAVIFAWSARDLLFRNNGWDVYARAFTFSGAVPLGGTERRLNTQLYGDQFVPRLSAQGGTSLVVWTSMGQDGSATGVFGRFINATGSPLSDEFRVNTTTLGAQEDTVLASDSNGRFLSAWTGPTYSGSRNDLFAQIYADASAAAPGFTTNYNAPTFVGDPVPTKLPTGVTNSDYTTPYAESPTLDYPGTVSAGGSGLPPANAFALAAGTYNGLFYEASGVTPDSAGYVVVSVTKDKAFNGKIYLGGSKPYSLGKGTFDDFGATTKIVNVGSHSLVVSLQLDLFGGNQIKGTVKSGDWTSSLLADRQTSKATGFSGAYTAIIPSNTTGPGGSSFGTINVASSGIVTFAGKLADGTAITIGGGSKISSNGVWPMYYNANGQFLMSWVQFNADPPKNMSGGDVVWIKSAQNTKKPYSGGFTNELSAVAALNSAVVSGSRQISFTGGGMDASDSTIQIAGKNKVASKGANIRSISVLANGTFSGSAILDGKTMSFQGALLNGGSGEGYFLNGSLSGKVEMQ